MNGARPSYFILMAILGCSNIFQGISSIGRGTSNIMQRQQTCSYPSATYQKMADPV